jgi:aldehyde:ferredoxin oxidoreductase
VSWEDWNDITDLYYEKRGWDKKTGWPTRVTLERFGLGDIADALEKIG